MTAALGLTQFLSDLLLGVSPIDPVAFGGTIAALAAVALAVNPVSALRAE